MVGGADTLAAQNDAAGWEIRARNDADQVFDRERRIVDQRDQGLAELAQIDIDRKSGGLPADLAIEAFLLRRVMA